MDDVAAAAGVKVIRTPTGEANVVAGMQAHDCVFGGEGGGGAIDPRIVAVRNSFVAMALTLNYMVETGLSLSQLVDGIPRYEMVKDKFTCPLEAAAKVQVAVRDAFCGRKGAVINDQDGIRIDLPQGWTQIRASNTEPIMRITTEAADADAANALAAEVRRIAEKVLAD